MRGRNWALVTLGLCLSGGGMTLRGGQGIASDYPPLPETFAQLVKEVPVIVRARIGQSSVRRALLKSTSPVALREYDAEILELFKSDGSVKVGGHVPVSQPGGKIELDDREYVTNNSMRLLERDQEVILFLYPDGNTYGIAYGDYGALAVKDDAVEVPKAFREQPVFSGQRTISVAQLARVIREVLQGRGIQAAHGDRKRWLV